MARATRPWRGQKSPNCRGNRATPLTIVGVFSVLVGVGFTGLSRIHLFFEASQGFAQGSTQLGDFFWPKDEQRNAKHNRNFRPT